MEKHESPEQAVIRELREELNVEVQPFQHLGFTEFEENGAVLKYHWFNCKIESGTLQLMEDKFDDFRFFSQFELMCNDELSANMKGFISRFNIESLIKL